jgi:hypothetical protein
MRIRRDRHVLEDLTLVPDVVSGRDDVGAQIEDLFGDGGRNSEPAGGVLAIDDDQVDSVGFDDVRKVLVDDVAAGGAKDIADKEDIHLKILHVRIMPMAGSAAQLC